MRQHVGVGHERGVCVVNQVQHQVRGAERRGRRHQCFDDCVRFGGLLGQEQASDGALLGLEHTHPPD